MKPKYRNAYLSRVEKYLHIQITLISHNLTNHSTATHISSRKHPQDTSPYRKTPHFPTHSDRAAYPRRRYFMVCPHTRVPAIMEYKLSHSCRCSRRPPFVHICRWCCTASRPKAPALHTCVGLVHFYALLLSTGNGRSSSYLVCVCAFMYAGLF